MTTGSVAGPPPDERDLDRKDPDVSRPADEELVRLQTLLFPERDHWIDLARRLDEPAVRAAETAAVLPESVRQALTRGPGLATTIAPVVEDAIHTSVRRDPGRLVDAIFPVMGPAIRRSITATLRDMIQSLNNMLDTSVSWRGLMWRLEARRTGKSFAEIVLLHTLVYQVQQVLLIHRGNGLLLQHVVAESLSLSDPSIVSGMLTAIQDFVNDSFNAGREGTLHTMQVGELTVWIEPGPHAYVAAIVRGHAPADLRIALQDAVARIHGEQALLLERFNGDAAPFEACRPLLEACLQSKFSERRQRFMSWPLGVALVLVVALLGTWAFVTIRDARQWDRFLERLRSEPGVVVVAAERRGGQYVLSGLHDPLAADPARLQAEAGYAPGDISSRWEQYYAADPAFVLARAAALLEPPSTTRLECASGVLTFSGSAPRAWIAERIRLALFVPGVQAVRAEKLRPQEVVDAEARAATLEQRRFLFAPDRWTLDESERSAIPAVVADIRALVSAARIAGLDVSIEVTGRTDDTGIGTENARLGARRADTVVTALVAAGLDRQLFSGAVAPPVSEPVPDSSQRALLRSVQFRARLTPIGDPPGRSR